MFTNVYNVFIYYVGLQYQSNSAEIKNFQKMTTITLSKKLNKLHLNKSSLVFKWLNEIAEAGCKKNYRINCVFTQGSSWKHSSLIDKTFDLYVALQNLKLKFEIRNDAPRGGKTGTHIVILQSITKK